MALVDPRLLETLRTPIQPPSDVKLRDLDSEMTSILDKTGIDVSEKVRLYNQALLRYNDMVKIASNKPTTAVVMKEKEPTTTADIKGEVVAILPEALQKKESQLVSRLEREVRMTLPKTLQEKGSQLVSRLKTTKWNDRGELLHEGVAIPGSNIVDLIHDLLRNRKTVDPIGWQQFANQMHAANIPMELVGNVARRQHIQKRTRIAPPIPNPKKKKKKTRQLPDAWESY